MIHSRQHNQLSDDELLAAYHQTGDKERLGDLLQRYTLLLLGVAMKYLKEKEQAQDAVQQVFLKVLTHLPKEKIENFKGWLYVLMRNHCLQLLRDRHLNLPEETLQYIPSGEDTSPKDLVLQEMNLNRMLEALEDLPEEQKTAITSFYLQKKSYQQIMDETGFSFMQVKSYIQNGKRKLKLILQKKAGNSRS